MNTVTTALSRLLALATLSSAAFVVSTAHAFGPNAHRASGRIAERHLSAAAARGVRELLGPTSLAEAATWADEVRSDPAWDHARSWHYVTIEDGETYESSAKSPDGDVIEAMRRHTATLRDRSRPKDERAIALRWLVHLVGDVHQPLHVGRGADRGGNEIDAEWFGRSTNLHSIWDTKLFESTKLSFSELAEFIDTSNPEQVARWQASELMDWVRESMALRERAYTVPEASFSGSYRYAYENLPIVRRRVAQAGVRLAGLLDAIFAEDGVVSPRPREYEARLRQVWTLASGRVDTLASAGALPERWAVAVDLEDTLVDRAGRVLPGVSTFAARVAAHGGRLVVVTAAPRPRAERAARALESAGVGVAALLIAEPGASRTPHWDAVAAGSARPGLPALDIVLWAGSELEDFPSAELERFGASFFLLPEPARPRSR